MAGGPLRAQFIALTLRAHSSGRPLDPLPTLQLGPHNGAWFAVGGGPVVQLVTSIADIAEVERAFPMAHELSHVLRIQEHQRPRWPAAAVVAVPLAVLLAIAAAVLPVATGATWPLALTVPALAVLWLLRLALQRSEEGATDATAAVVFGEVLTPAGVRRVALEEGRFSRWVPAVIRSHDKPGRRRQRGLQAVRGVPAPGGLSRQDREQFPLPGVADSGEERGL